MANIVIVVIDVIERTTIQRMILLIISPPASFNKPYNPLMFRYRGGNHVYNIVSKCISKLWDKI